MTKFNYRMKRQDKVNYVLENNLPVVFGLVIPELYYPKNEADLLCKFCQKPLNLINGNEHVDKFHIFRIKGCKCEGKSNKYYFESIFGKNNELWAKQSINKKGIFNLDWHIQKYGEVEGKIKYEEFLKRSKQSLDDFIRRYGTELGIIKFEEFKNKSKQNKENFIKRHGEELGLIKWKEFKEKKKKSNSLSLDWWIKKFNGDEITARKEYSKFQTRSLDWFKNTYGDEIGIEKYKEKCRINSYANLPQYFIDRFGEEEGVEKFLEFNAKKRSFSVNKYTQSKVAQEFITSVSSCFTNEKIKSFENSEYYVRTTTGLYAYDLVFLNLKVCIEFHGDIWHMNPKKYAEFDIHPIKNVPAKTIWDYDSKKQKAIEEKGFKYICIWESEYKKDKENVVKTVIEEIEKWKNMSILQD